MRLHVDIVSDVICPWCFIGKRRLEEALRTLGGQVETQVVWHPFELNPEMPPEGIERRAYREAKFGSPEASRALDARLTAAGAHEGISFAFDRIRRTPNTLDAHRLIWFAQRESLQDPIVEALFRRYFLEGEDIGQRKTLVDVAAASGLSAELVDRFLQSDESVADVRQAEAEAWRLGIHGVPHFIIDGKYAISGAQSAEILTAVFQRVLTPEAQRDAAPAVQAGDASGHQ